MGNKVVTVMMSDFLPQQNYATEEVHPQTGLIYYTHDRIFCFMCPSLSFGTSTEIR